MTKKYAAVIGNPISHSLSPLLHRFLLRKYNIEADYQAILVAKEDFINQIDALLTNVNMQGFNVTIPYKEDIYQLFQDRNYEISEQAKAVSAINTVFKKDGKIYGDNTDIIGFETNLITNSVNLSNNSALIIGAGGAAGAVLHSLASKFKKIYIYNRTKENAENLVNRIRNVTDARNISILDQILPENLENLDLIVNSTSIGMKNDLNHNFSLKSVLNPNCHIYDLIYNPLITPLLKEAQELNLPIITGIGMLIYQALPGFEQWFGHKPNLNSTDISLLNDILIKNL